MSLSTPDNACNPSGDSDNVDPFAPEDDLIVVLGIGNVLWADEGFGVRCVEALQRQWQFGSKVRLVDGGTQGLYLIQHVQAAKKLLIFDAIDYGLAPGTLKLVEDDEVPRFMGAKKMSLHQTGFQEVLMLALLTEKYPESVLLVGCQPEELEDYGGSLRPVVRLAMDDALALGLDRLRSWGAAPVPRDVPPEGDDMVTVPTLSLAAYESGRPDAEAACRVGDERFLAPSA
jgi:hydrogenase maturation protease